MKVTLKNIEILNIMAYVNSGEAIVTNPTAKFSIAFAWAFRKGIKILGTLAENIELLHKEINDYYSDDEHSQINEDDKENRVIKEEFVKEYNDKLTELFNQENEIEIEKIKLQQIAPGGAEGLYNTGMSIVDIDMLSWIIDDTE